jgi:hypothetical protein
VTTGNRFRLVYVIKDRIQGGHADVRSYREKATEARVGGCLQPAALPTAPHHQRVRLSELGRRYLAEPRLAAPAWILNAPLQVIDSRSAWQQAYSTRTKSPEPKSRDTVAE